MYISNALLKIYFKTFAKYFSDVGTSNNSEEQYSVHIHLHVKKYNVQLAIKRPLNYY